MNFDYTEQEVEEVLMKHFDQVSPPILKSFPSKEKKKYLCLIPIIKAFEKDRKYTEKETNAVLKNVYAYDYCIIRRYLVDYGFLSRMENGQFYWVNEAK